MVNTLQERDNQLYVVSAENSSSEPLRISSWFPLGLHAPGFKRSYGDEKIGQRLEYLGAGTYRDKDRLVYRLEHGGQTYSSFVETEPIPEPAQRGRKLDTRYYEGEWQKLTRRGWVSA